MTIESPRRPDPELRLLLGLAHRLPRIRGAGVLGASLQRLYLRKRRAPVLARILGVWMTLIPADFMEGPFLFYPQLCEAAELDFLRSRLRPGDLFLDAGAHIGFYSLQISQVVGEHGRIVAIEADPENRARLERHIAMNRLRNVTVVDRGVADERTALRLGRNESGNTGGHTFLMGLDRGVEVLCEPLEDILRERGIERVDAMKMDIEGMEYRVLRRFLANAPRGLWPRAIVVEFHPHWVDLAGGNVVDLLTASGYRESSRQGANHFLVLDRS